MQIIQPILKKILTTYKHNILVTERRQAGKKNDTEG